jgi:glycosyltransferase involved in cell wall biosynthesis
MRDKMEISHTFAVCAYKKSEYLESCIKSLLAQETKTNIIICTSTPSDYIRDIAEKYDIPYYVRNGESDIQDDWNFACKCAGTDWITLAHQDDMYSPGYATEILKAVKKYNDVQLAFTDYRPLKHYRISYDANCFLRRLLKFPVWNKNTAHIPALKKAALSLGNTICCSAVTYNLKTLKMPIFRSELKFSLDWDTFYRLAGKKGRFVYIDKPLTYFRIHSGATTNKFIITNGRLKEDLSMFSTIWPEPIAKLIMKFYVLAYRTYKE